MILDTSYVIALAAGEDDAVNFARKHASSGRPQRIPAAVILELYVSVGVGDNPTENARQYEELLGNLPVVELGQNIARRAGALQRQHLASDTKPTLGFADASIAATGLVYNEPVTTRDTDDFGSVDNLTVRTWS